MSIAIRLFPFVLIVLLANALFTVDQTSQAIVLQFGEYKDVYTTPGLKIKIPFIQDVNYYDKRVLDYDLPPIKITTAGQKRLVVDTYTRYKIVDPLLFFKSVKPSSELGAKMRLEAIVSSAVRNVMGRFSLFDILSKHRLDVRNKILEEVRGQSKKLGLDVIDVRVVRTELPTENRKAVFSRMNAELDRFAKQNRAKGSENAEIIKSKAEKEHTIILAQANKESDILRGAGEEQSLNIIATAIESDPAFYSFYTLLETYKDTIGSDTNLILSTKSSLLSYLTDSLEKRLF